MLVVLDGLDEVPGVERRADLIRAIEVGVSRLHEVAASLQVIITSRPAAFTSSPGLPKSSYPHLGLSALQKKHIKAYSEQWITTKELSDQEAIGVRRILEDTLEQPHLRDLATNPMQLAILLSLMRKIGDSLPEERTTLYDSYVDLFFARESE